MSIKIKVYNKSQQPEVLKLWDDCGLLYTENDPVKDIQRKLKTQPDLFLVAVDIEKIVGTIMAGYEGHRGWINYLAVDTTKRRSGIGR